MTHGLTTARRGLSQDPTGGQGRSAAYSISFRAEHRVATIHDDETSDIRLPQKNCMLNTPDVLSGSRIPVMAHAAPVTWKLARILEIAIFRVYMLEEFIMKREIKEKYSISSC